MTPPFFVLFHSMRGGVGRTSSAFNAAVQLAESGDAVLFVDLDLEAPSFMPFVTGAKPSIAGLAHFFTESLETSSAPGIADFLVLPTDMETLRVLNAGSFSADYASRLGTIDWHKLFDGDSDDGRGPWLLRALKDRIRELAPPPTYVIMDSRPGLSPLSAVAVRYLADAVIEVLSVSEQSRRTYRAFWPSLSGVYRNAKVGAGLPVRHLASLVPLEHEGVRDALEEIEGILGIQKDALLSVTLDPSLFVSERVADSQNDERLYKEYSKVVGAIRSCNPHDVFSKVDLLRARLSGNQTGRGFEDELRSLADEHPSDPRVLRLGAHWAELRGDLQEARAIAIKGLASAGLSARSKREFEDLCRALDARTAQARRAVGIPDTTSLYDQSRRAFEEHDPEKRLALRKSVLQALSGQHGLTLKDALFVPGTKMRARLNWQAWLNTASESVPDMEDSIKEVLSEYLLEQRGRVTRWGERGYGFIRLADGEGDVFFHAADVVDEMRSHVFIRTGSLVTCNLFWNKDARRWGAKNVQIQLEG